MSAFIEKIDMYSVEKAGEFYGYPKCCIKSFVETPEYLISLAQKSVSNETGFIPCFECAMLILNKMTSLSGLITNRICPLPFPFSASEKDVQKYISSLTLKS